MMQLHDCKETAAMLHVHPKTLQKWAAAGKIHPVHLAGRRKLQFRAEEIERFVLDSQSGPKAGPTVDVPKIPVLSHQRLTAPQVRGQKSKKKGDPLWMEHYGKK